MILNAQVEHAHQKTKAFCGLFCLAGFTQQTKGYLWFIKEFGTYIRIYIFILTPDINCPMH